MLESIADHPLLDGALPVLEKCVRAVDVAEEEFAAKLAAGVFEPGLLFDGHRDMAERAAQNPVALHKLNGIRTAIESGLIPV